MQTTVNLEGSEDDIARWIWINIVPKSGQASSLQGELLRAIEKLRWEAQSNGNINWDACFAMFVDFLGNHLLAEPRFTKESKAEIAADLDRLRHFLPVDDLENDDEAGGLPYVEDDLYDRLTSHVVRYCRLHPQLIPLESNLSQYR
jgi:hypothetical protein